MDLFLQDIKRGARSLGRSPAFTIAAVATLALGIGANTAVFSIVNAALIRALPYPQSGRLVLLREEVRGEQWSFSPPNFADVRAQSTSFDGVAASRWTSATLTGAGEPAALDGYLATEDFLRVLRVTPSLGRAFLSSEFVPGQDHVVILSHALWQDRFGGRPDVIGSAIRLGGEPYTVVGVMPSGQEFPRHADYWAPLTFTAQDLQTQRGAHYLNVLARLRDGVSPAQALSDVRHVAARLAAAYPATNAPNSATLTGLQEALVGDVRTMLLVFFATVTLVLLIACTNVANLLLVRASGRTRDVAVSLALGARHGDLVRRSLAESLLIAGTGAGIGVLVASWLTSALSTLRPGALRNVHDIALDGRVLAYTAVMAAGTGVIFGLLPVLRVRRMTDLYSLLRTGGRGVLHAGAGWRVRGGLVSAQLALAVMLLAGAGLLARSFMHLQHVDPGFSTANAYVLPLSLPDARYGKPDPARAFYAALTGRLRAIPGVTLVSGASLLPLDENDFQISVREVDGRLLTDAEQQAMRSPQIRLAMPDYMRSLHIPFVRGRDFTAADGAGAPLVAIVNEAAARLLWKDVDPIGHHVEIGTKFGLGGARGGGTVVGVVRDVHDEALSQPPNPTIFFAHAQFPVSDMSLVLSAAPGVDARALAAPVRAALSATDPELAAPALQPFEAFRSGSLAQPRFAMLVTGFFAVVALLLAAVGVYGVMANLVSQRVSEIGVRMALGADAGDVVRETLRRMTAPVAIGVVLGLGGALAAARALASMLFGVGPSDPLTLAAVTITLVSVAVAASYLPARRASRVDPIEALRAE